jgi:hypothetical protein
VTPICCADEAVAVEPEFVLEEDDGHRAGGEVGVDVGRRVAGPGVGEHERRLLARLAGEEEGERYGAVEVGAPQDLAVEPAPGGPAEAVGAGEDFDA